jgi:hypothetical protein
MSFETIYSMMDSLFEPFFGLPGDASTSYLIGVVFLAIAAKLVGEVSVDFLFGGNLERIARLKAKADKMGELSLLALSVEDEAAYEACNRSANENFGKLFYLSLTLSAASLWPVFFALGWLQSRFEERASDLLPVGYAGTFVVAYVIVFIIFKRFKPYLWKVPGIPHEGLESSILSDEEIKEMMERLNEK